jgi:hypothetical protein
LFHICRRTNLSTESFGTAYNHANDQRPERDAAITLLTFLEERRHLAGELHDLTQRLAGMDRNPGRFQKVSATIPKRQEAS